jgi:hypothetical protein
MIFQKLLRVAVLVIGVGLVVVTVVGAVRGWETNALLTVGILDCITTCVGGQVLGKLSMLPVDQFRTPLTVFLRTRRTFTKKSWVSFGRRVEDQASLIPDIDLLSLFPVPVSVLTLRRSSLAPEGRIS